MPITCQIIIGIMGLKHRVAKICKNVKYCAPLVFVLLKSLDERMTMYEQSLVYIFASFLIHDLRLAVVTMTEKVKAFLLGELQLLTNTNRKPDERNNSEPQPKRRKLFSFMNNIKHSIKSTNISLENEISMYLREPLEDEVDFLKF